ncbi:MAG: hypothetical protein ABSC37_16895, partial [Xanthobacteraceae bacterium]
PTARRERNWRPLSAMRTIRGRFGNNIVQVLTTAQESDQRNFTVPNCDQLNAGTISACHH